MASRQKDKAGQPPGSWYRARKEALRQLSIKYNDFIPETGAPTQMLKLAERPDHCNYAECPRCAEVRKALEGALKARQPKSRLLQIRRAQVAHIQEIHSEREVVRGFRTEATEFSSNTLVPHG
eukprot:scaffold102155_cov36-Tisochrysis_lutea.AAC.1